MKLQEITLFHQDHSLFILGVKFSLPVSWVIFAQVYNRALHGGVDRTINKFAYYDNEITSCNHFRMHEI